MNGNRPAAPGEVRSFSGQGHEVWGSSASHNVISRTQSLSTIHSSIGNSLFTRSGFGGRAGLSATTQFTGGSPLLSNRGFAGGTHTTASFQQIRGFGFNRFGYPSGWRGGFGRGCWNCGFGFGNRWGWGFGGWGWGGWGLGWGWGSPWLGWGWGWGWDPFWYDPWWNWGWSGYYGYPTNNYYIYNGNGSDNYAPQDNSPAPPPQDNQYDDELNDRGAPNQGAPNGNWVTPNEAQPSAASGAPSLSVPVLIYMKNGSVLTVRDYWMIDGEFHYILMNGAQKSVDLEQVDLARSNAQNAKSGVRFMFKSEPSAPPANESPAPPAAQPNTSTPSPVVKPEART